jgi:flagellar protein FlaJ
LSRFTTAYKEELRMPAQRWFLITLLVTVMTICIEASLVLAFPRAFDTLFLTIPFFSLSAIVCFLMVFYPIFLWEQRGSDIDREMHLFITRMGVLAASQSARKEMFDIISRMREYRSLAVEINKIFIMVDKWNVSLERACRFVAQTTPSELLADFLNRLAHGVEGGEAAEVFFQTEQVVVMNQYTLKYQGAMMRVEWMKEIFVSLVVSVLFIIVFSTLAPFISKGQDPNFWLGTSVGVFLLVEISFLVLLSVVVPGESIWSDLAIQTPTRQMIRRGLYASFFLSFAFAAIALLIPFNNPSGFVLLAGWLVSIALLVVSLFFYPRWNVSVFEGIVVAAIFVTIFFVSIQTLTTMEYDALHHKPFPLLYDFMNGRVYLPLAIAYILTPWLILGHFVNREEDKIKRRDDNFAAFLRSLGAAVAATSKDITVPLGKLRRHDFGPLTKNVDDLYKRLAMRIDRPKAWEYFSAETLSELISKFTEMYVEGIKAGGSPKTVSSIISENFLKIVGLRKMKYDSASTLSGILYGLAFAISLVLYMTLMILENFDKLAQNLTISLKETGGTSVPLNNIMILNAGAFNFDVLGAAMLFMILVHALVSAVTTRTISGGHRGGAAWHFVLLTWTSVAVAVVTMSAAWYMLPAP